MFLVKISDTVYIRHNEIVSIETTKTEDVIDVFVKTINNTYNVFHSNFNKSCFHLLDNFKAEITALCYQNIIAAECNCKDNINCTFQSYISDYVDKLSEDDITKDSYEIKKNEIMDEVLDDLYDMVNSD